MSGSQETLKASSAHGNFVDYQDKDGKTVFGVDSKGGLTLAPAPPVLGKDGKPVPLKFGDPVGTLAITINGHPYRLPFFAMEGAVAITKQPENQNVAPGKPAVFSVTATGVPPLSYQWRKNGFAIPGADGPSHTTLPAVIEDSGAVYDVVVENGIGSVTSNPATLTVAAASSAAT